MIIEFELWSCSNWFFYYYYNQVKAFQPSSKLKWLNFDAFQTFWCLQCPLKRTNVCAAKVNIDCQSIIATIEEIWWKLKLFHFKSTEIFYPVLKKIDSYSNIALTLPQLPFFSTWNKIQKYRIWRAICCFHERIWRDKKAKQKRRWACVRRHSRNKL